MLNAIFLDDLGKYGQEVTKSDFQILKVIGRGSYGSAATQSGVLLAAAAASAASQTRISSTGGPTSAADRGEEGAVVGVAE